MRDYLLVLHGGGSVKFMGVKNDAEAIELTRKHLGIKTRVMTFKQFRAADGEVLRNMLGDEIFGEFSTLSPDVSAQCTELAKLRGWTAPVAWKKVGKAGEILGIPTEEGLEFALQVAKTTARTS